MGKVGIGRVWGREGRIGGAGGFGWFWWVGKVVVLLGDGPVDWDVGK